MITRQQALDFLNETIENKNIIKHMLACEVMMQALARELGIRNHPPAGLSADKAGEAGELGISEDEWAMAGLLHDGDYLPDVPPEKQGIEIANMLKSKGYEVPDNVAYAMAAHNWHNTGVKPKSKMDWAIFCGDSLTGLIVAATLVLPSRRLADLTVENVLNRFRENHFAKGTRRDEIALCEEKLEIPLPEFVKITLEAMQGISKELGL